MSGSRRDFTFLVLGNTGAHLFQDITDGSVAGVFGSLTAGAIVLAIIWVATGWRISRRERPL